MIAGVNGRGFVGSTFVHSTAAGESVPVRFLAAWLRQCGQGNAQGEGWSRSFPSRERRSYRFIGDGVRVLYIV